MSRNVQRIWWGTARPVIKDHLRWITATVRADPVGQENGVVKDFNEIPRIPSLPLIGSLWAYLPIIGKYRLKELHLSYFKKYHEYGEIFREDLSTKIRFVYLHGVEDFERYFRTEGKDPERLLFDTIRLYREARPDIYVGGGLAAMSGAGWYNMRSKVQPHLLRPKEIHRYLPGVDQIAQDLVSQIPSFSDGKGEVKDFRRELARWGIESIGFIGLDTRLGALLPESSRNQEVMALIKTGDELFSLFHELEFGFSFLWRFVPTPKYKRLIKAMDFFSELSLRHIAEATKRMEENQDGEHELTLLETFLVKEDMNPRLATTMIMDMLLAGVDTTSTTSNYVLYHLARNPEVQEKAYQEVTRAIKSGNGQVTSGVLNEIRYLKSCIKESMRITPTVNGIPRTLKEDTVVRGYKVPAGAMLFFTTCVAGQLESNFKDAMTFKPERWMDNDNKPNPFAFMPFGIGIRSCIGRRIAEIEMQTLLIRILQKYRVEYHHEDLECITKLVNVPKTPLKLRFVPRES